jgi:lactoylglutathione lyase
MTDSYSHLGVCVSDLDRSLRFYTEALGFEENEGWAVGPEFAGLMEVEGVALQSRFLRRPGCTLELLFFDAPGFDGPAERRPINQLGLTHLCFKVDDVDASAARITAAGGTVLDQTRTTFPNPDGTKMDFVYCTDPDGIRIELMHLPG